MSHPYMPHHVTNIYGDLGLMMTRNTQSAKLKGNLTWKSSSVQPRSSNNDLRTGTEYSCSRRYCKYQHVDISSSYPKHSKKLVKSFAIKPSKEPMKVQTHKQTKIGGFVINFPNMAHVNLATGVVTSM